MRPWIDAAAMIFLVSLIVSAEKGVHHRLFKIQESLNQILLALGKTPLKD